jgi:outer membrane protein OmpA-like peptidoglycan-associated protein
MQQRALVLALTAAGTLFAAPARAADDCSQMFIYSVNQFCRTLSNGFSQCQPVGMVGPAPNCAKPGVPAIMPVPLAPPVTQAVPPYPFMPPFPVQTAAPQAVSPAPVPPSATAPVAAKPVTPPVAVSQPPVPATPAPMPAPAPAAPVATALPTPTPLPVVAAPAAAKPAIAPVPAAAATPSAAPAMAAMPPATPAPSVVAAPVTAKPQPAPATPAPVPATPAPVAPVPTPPAVVTPAATPPSAAPVSITLADGLAHFGFDRADLSAQGRAELDAWLKQPLPKGKNLKVTGHADRLGPAEYNLKLSGRRAETVKKYLVEKGMNAGDIQVVAKGESEPVKHCKGGASKATIACLAPNRRVEIDP